MHRLAGFLVSRYQTGDDNNLASISVPVCVCIIKCSARDLIIFIYNKVIMKVQETSQKRLQGEVKGNGFYTKGSKITAVSSLDA